ncbi:MAG: peptide MFS transporter [Elusimicrobiota bacterium]|jgi:POT family proton-dependent oligopeptide transporter
MNEVQGGQNHPKGLYVLFATEMWERFSFYSMLSLFTLYMRDGTEGFGWAAADATSLYANYLMFVYFSPLVGGWLADRKLGYRRAVMAGGLFFMAGHLLLSFKSLPIVYLALTCLVLGNGLFKPNVSAMVGNLYPEGSHLKDRAFNIFYMGINIGAFMAPVAMEAIKSKWGYHPAFATAALGMLVSVGILWAFRGLVEDKGRAEAPAEGSSPAAPRALDEVPDWKRCMALVIIYFIVIVFWMVFHQNGSTLTYWANDNTAWSVSGTISNAINPFWVVTLTFPLVWFWKWLDRRGLEPSTPTKMGFGMLLTGLSFLLLFWAAKTGEAMAPAGSPYAFKVSPVWLIASYGVVTLGELMLSPMGLSLVSKVAPVRLRGVMMGGWFAATAVGNKLTAIGVYWDQWLHSTFFLVLGAMALAMSVVLFLLVRPLKRWMPGV